MRPYPRSLRAPEADHSDDDCAAHANGGGYHGWVHAGTLLASRFAARRSDSVTLADLSGQGQAHCTQVRPVGVKRHPKMPTAKLTAAAVAADTGLTDLVAAQAKVPVLNLSVASRLRADHSLRAIGSPRGIPAGLSGHGHEPRLSADAA